jgi:predicted nucleic acid-binding protein
MADRVLIDTCIWAGVFSKSGSAQKQTVDQLIEQDRVVVIGPVLAEVLCGFRRPEQADWVASRMKDLGWWEVEFEDWCRAAALGRQTAAAGHRLPLTELVIVAVARRRDLSVYTIDPHFDIFVDLKRFLPD